MIVFCWNNSSRGHTATLPRSTSLGRPEMSVINYRSPDLLKLLYSLFCVYIGTSCPTVLLIIKQSTIMLRIESPLHYYDSNIWLVELFDTLLLRPLWMLRMSPFSKSKSLLNCYCLFRAISSILQAKT